MFSDILSNILCGILSDTLFDVLKFKWSSIWNPIWHSIWHLVWHSDSLFMFIWHRVRAFLGRVTGNWVPRCRDLALLLTLRSGWVKTPEAEAVSGWRRRNVGRGIGAALGWTTTSCIWPGMILHDTPLNHSYSFQGWNYQSEELHEITVFILDMTQLIFGSIIDD